MLTRPTEIIPPQRRPNATPHLWPASDSPACLVEDADALVLYAAHICVVALGAVVVCREEVVLQVFPVGEGAEAAGGLAKAEEGRGVVLDVVDDLEQNLVGEVDIGSGVSSCPPFFHFRLL